LSRLFRMSRLQMLAGSSALPDKGAHESLAVSTFSHNSF